MTATFTLPTRNPFTDFSSDGRDWDDDVISPPEINLVNTSKYSIDDIKYGLVCPHCNKYAFYYAKRPAVGQSMDAANVIIVTAVTPVPGEQIRCQFCKKKIDFLPSYIRKVNKEFVKEQN